MKKRALDMGTWRISHGQITGGILLFRSRIDLRYQDVAVTSLNMTISNHVPLLLDVCGAAKGDHIFRFELCWLERLGFLDMVV
jgi:hypothetical protein